MKNTGLGSGRPAAPEGEDIVKSETTGEETTAPPKLAHNRQFNLLWSAGALSEFGSRASDIAIPLLVLALSGSAVTAGIVATTVAVVRTVARLPGGAITDRFDRRKIMMVSDAVSFLMMATLACALLLNQGSVVLVLVVAAVVALVGSMSDPAEIAAVSNVVPKGQRGIAFARNEARSSAASLAGQPIGGLLFGLGRAAPFAFNAASHAISFVLIASMKGPLPPSETERAHRSMVSEIVDGISYVAHTKFLRVLILIVAPINFALGGAIFSLSVTLATAGVPAPVIGLAQGLVGVGSLAGALAASWLMQRLTMRSLLTMTVFGLAICFAIATFLTSQFAMAIPLAAGMTLVPVVNAALFGHFAETVPEHLHGRVISVIIMLSATVGSVAPVAAGILITEFGGFAAMTLSTASAVLAASLLLINRSAIPTTRASSN